MSTTKIPRMVIVMDGGIIQGVVAAQRNHHMFDFETYAHDASVRAMEAAQLHAALLRSESSDVRGRAIYCECSITAAADCLIALATQLENQSEQ